MDQIVLVARHEIDGLTRADGLPYDDFYYEVYGPYQPGEPALVAKAAELDATGVKHYVATLQK